MVLDLSATRPPVYWRFFVAESHHASVLRSIRVCLVAVLAFALSLFYFRFSIFGFYFSLRFSVVAFPFSLFRFDVFISRLKS